MFAMLLVVSVNYLLVITIIFINLYATVNGKVVPVHVFKAYGRNGGITLQNSNTFIIVTVATLLLLLRLLLLLSELLISMSSYYRLWCPIVFRSPFLYPPSCSTICMKFTATNFK
jgi:hypothetical protein